MAPWPIIHRKIVALSTNVITYLCERAVPIDILNSPHWTHSIDKIM